MGNMNYTEMLAVLTMSLFLLLEFTGTVLNIVLLVVFAKHPETRTPENVLLINLCISDIVYLLGYFITLPGAFIITESICLVLLFSRSFMIALNADSVVAIGVQRYIGLRHFRIRLPTDKDDFGNSLLILAGVWIVAVLQAAVEVLVAHQLYRFYCFEIAFIGVPLYRLLVYALVPSVLILVFYIAAACRVKQSLPNIESNVMLDTLRGRRKRSARIIFALAAVFTLTYIPLFFYLYLWQIYKETLATLDWLPPVTAAIFLTSTLNPVFNPIALCLASTQLRHLYKKYCCCCCQQSPASPALE